MKLNPVIAHDGVRIGWQFNCPGCATIPIEYLDTTHLVYDVTHPAAALVWGFNGSQEQPTFSPSILVRRRWGDDQVPMVCHFFLRDGWLEYCSDSTHALAGQRIQLPEWSGWAA